MSMEFRKLNARHLEAVPFLSMEFRKLNARHLEAVSFLSMEFRKLNARHVEAVPFVSIVDKKQTHCKHEKRKIDCGVCYKVQMKEIVDREVKSASYGSTKDTNNLKKCRRLNKVVYSVAHKDAALVIVLLEFSRTVTLERF